MTSRESSRPRPARGARWQAVLVCGLLVLVTIVAYEGVRHNDFVSIDDPLYITHNRRVLDGLSVAGLVWAFTTDEASNYHPLTWLSHMLDVELFGTRAAGHHLSSLLLHSAASLILFAVLRRMTQAFWCSALVAAIFALHPLHVESVAWAAERKDVLAAFFWMVTLYAYAAYADRPGWVRYACVLLSLLLGLLAKPMLVTLPFVLILLDHWPLGRRSRTNDEPHPLGRPRFATGRLIAEKVPLMILAAASALATYQIQHDTGAMDTTALGLRLANAITSYTGYLAKWLWPVDLAVLYPFPMHGIPAWKTARSALLIGGITAAAVVFGRRRPYLAVGWLWYLGTLVPVIGLVKVGYQAAADRYMYIPSMGLSIMVAWSAAELASLPIVRAGIVAVACLALAAMTATTHAQVQHWRDSLALYEQAVRATENNWVAYANLGVVYARRGDHARAIEALEQSIRANPDFDHSQYNLGVQMEKVGRVDRAMDAYRRTLELSPHNVRAHKSLGRLLEARGMLGEAMEHFRAALQMEPDDVNLLLHLGVMSHRQGDLTTAIRQYREVLRIDPQNRAAQDNLAVALAAQGTAD